MKAKKVAKRKRACTHKNAWPDFLTWEIRCPDCRKVRGMDEREGNRIFRSMTGMGVGSQ